MSSAGQIEKFFKFLCEIFVGLSKNCVQLLFGVLCHFFIVTQLGANNKVISEECVFIVLVTVTVITIAIIIFLGIGT